MLKNKQAENIQQTEDVQHAEEVQQIEDIDQPSTKRSKPRRGKKPQEESDDDITTSHQGSIFDTVQKTRQQSLNIDLSEQVEVDAFRLGHVPSFFNAPLSKPGRAAGKKDRRPQQLLPSHPAFPGHPIFPGHPTFPSHPTFPIHPTFLSHPHHPNLETRQSLPSPQPPRDQPTSPNQPSHQSQETQQALPSPQALAGQQPHGSSASNIKNTPDPLALPYLLYDRYALDGWDKFYDVPCAGQAKGDHAFYHHLDANRKTHPHPKFTNEVLMRGIDMSIREFFEADNILKQSAIDNGIWKWENLKHSSHKAQIWDMMEDSGLQVQKFAGKKEGWWFQEAFRGWLTIAKAWITLNAKELSGEILCQSMQSRDNGWRRTATSRDIHTR